MKEKTYNIKVSVYAHKTISVDATSFEEACELAEDEMRNRIYNYKIDFNYEFENGKKAIQEENDWYDDDDYDYRYEHEENSWLGDY